MHIVIIGGNGGIGFAMLQHTLERFPEAQITATFRRRRPQWPHPRVNWQSLDASNEDEVRRLSDTTDSVDWLINCIGLLHSAQQGPEKNINALNAEFFQHNMMVNTLPMLLLAKYFTPLLKRSTAPKFAALSARVGSISDNRLGGWYSYRASKAALNMVVKTLSIEWQRTLKHGTLLALHPGTTDTALSAPFQANVPPGKLFTPAYVAQQLTDIITNATPEQSGSFLAYDGQTIPW
ncbi:SDR family oxidoreductase [Vibrio sp. H11]|uniref:SDR family oxidoreductase n=1 Tax=Vibrio sp. H11 TaxID=2565928 RepID=UPI0010A5DBC2|nr:SDR family oxidoreductase [Vibrio sp. H11]